MPSDNTMLLVDSCVQGASASWEFDFCLAYRQGISHLKGGPYRLKHSAVRDLVGQLSLHLARLNRMPLYPAANIPQLANRCFRVSRDDKTIDYDFAVSDTI